MQDQRRAQQCRAGKRRMWLSITPLPPLPLQPLQSPTAPSMKKKTLQPPSPPSPPPPPPLLFLFPTAAATTPLPPHFHHSPSPCSRILLYKPGTDVCWGRAERPRCSGCQPHAFHSEMKAHSSPSCEANFQKKKKKSRGGKKQTLQMPSSAFKSSTYMSAPFCLHHHVQLSASSMSATCLLHPHII